MILIRLLLSPMGSGVLFYFHPINIPASWFSPHPFIPDLKNDYRATSSLIEKLQSQILAPNHLYDIATGFVNATTLTACLQSSSHYEFTWFLDYHCQGSDSRYIDCSSRKDIVSTANIASTN